MIVKILTVCAALFVLSASGAENVLMQEDFSSPDSLQNWKNTSIASIAKGESSEGKDCLKIIAPAGSAQKYSLISRNLPVEQYQGKAVMLEAWTKGENISETDKKYLGPKVMLYIKDDNGVEQWLDHQKQYGTYPWTKKTVFVRIPENLKELRLILGLEKAEGTLYITKLKILEVPQARPMTKASTEKLQSKPKFRGVMSGNSLEEADLKELGEVWHANLMRYQINGAKKANVKTEADYDAWLDKHLANIDRILPIAKKYGIKIVIDLHSGPSMNQNELASNLLSWTFESQDKLVAVWEKIAAKYKNEKSIYGYDILNEPREDNYVYTENGPLDWNRLSERVAKAIRKIDPSTPIIVEAPNWANPAGFSGLSPIDLPGIIYSVHFYIPHDITHQGVHNSAKDFNYPGVVKGVMWNKDQLRKALAPVIAFQKKWNVPIYVGEFGCIRWAPGDSRERYIQDCIEIFEEQGWDWTYHAFREWDGWSVEHTGSKPGGSGEFVKDSPAKRLLIEALGKNIH